MPIELRIIKKQVDALVVALFRERLQRIFRVRSASNDVPVGNFRIEHRETVVMSRGDGDVFHARRLGQRDPGLGIEFLRIKKLWQVLTFVQLQLAIMKDPLAHRRARCARPSG
jgi:hypothetical protein